MSDVKTISTNQANFIEDDQLVIEILKPAVGVSSTNQLLV
jgi:hypothetical protein